MNTQNIPGTAEKLHEKLSLNYHQIPTLPIKTGQSKLNPTYFFFP